MKKRQTIGTISGKELMTGAGSKPNRNDGPVKGGTGYHRSARDYNRKGKEAQRLRNRLKDYGSGVAFVFALG